MKKSYFAAIDIGTNAGRMLIGYVIPEGDHLSVKKALLVRIPLRLGEEVFKSGDITGKKLDNFLHAMQGFSHIMQSYDVKAYRAVATSAMREAKSQKEIQKTIKKLSGIDIEVIDGDEEAELIFSTFITQNLDHSKSYLFIDVGGGSTELNILIDGKRIKQKSFKIGTIRLKSGKVDPSVWDDIASWIKKHCGNLEDIDAIGTGGNANRLVKIQKKAYLEPLTYKEIRKSRNAIAQLSIKERVEEMRMKPDRADVIVPATDIYLKILDLAKIEKMYVPKMGVADGIILDLYNKLGE